ncbi:MAG: alpha-L-rhamnosidase C-terminal domain-containing protein [Fimbriimonas sp.]
MDALPEGHPLRRANWIWPGFYMYLQNHFAQFRWDFELAEVAHAVPFFVTADKSYRLYVNGRYVGRGPARGYQAHWPYDEVDLAPFLRAGENWISIEAYQPGVSTFQYLHENYAGVLVATTDPALERAMGKATMRRSPGHRTNTARYSLQIDFQEHFDLREDDRAWIYGSVAPKGWHPDILPPAAQKLYSLPFGRAPYYTVEPRGIPPLRETFAAPALPTTHATGRSHPGYATAPNVSWHWNAEGTEVAEWRDAQELAARIEGDFLQLTLPTTGAGAFHAVVIPMGEYVLGVLDVEVDGAVGGEILDFQHDQFFRDGRPHFVTPGDGSMVALGNRLILRAGSNAHEFYHPLGFGVVTLIARDLEKPLTIRIRVRKVGYPFSMRGAFTCSDPVLNEIHTASRRTQGLCALDAYMDTPWREQAQWWGDARVQARNTFYLDGDARLLARGIRSLAGQNVSGLTPGHAPTSSYWCVLPDFALTWIITLWDHYWQTGELTLFREMLPRVGEVLAYFDTPEARHPSGLLRYDDRFWLFQDWSDLPKDAIPTFLNLWYVLALRHLDKLHVAAGLPSEWGRVADAHAALVVRHAFDPAYGCFVSVLDEDLKQNGPPSVHDQTLALMLGLQPSSHEHFLNAFLLPYLRDEKVPGAKPSAFWATYVFEQAIARGHALEAVAFIRRHWTPMLGTGTTWEDFDWREESGGSACHAWTAHPSFHFVNALAGVVQSGPAWASIEFRPTFPEDMDHTSALVPSPRGDIVTQWRREEGTIKGTLTVPEGVRVESEMRLERTGQTYRFEV